MPKNVLHPIMKKVFGVIAAPDRPALHHAGGPAVKIVRYEGPACHAIAVWHAELLADTIRPEERDACAELMRRATVRPQPPYNELGDPNTETRDHGSPGRIAASCAARARAAMAGGYDARAATYAADSALLVLARLEGAKVKAYVTELDDRLLAYEYLAAARDKGGREVSASRVLWRGSDAKGDCGHWLVRASAGQYAYLSKEGARWKLTEGPRDDILACVPDALFEHATATAIARDVALSVAVVLPVKGKDDGNFWTV